MHFKRDRYVCGHQNKHGKKACPDNFRPIEKKLATQLLIDLNTLYFSKTDNSYTGQAIDNKDASYTSDIENFQNQLLLLRAKKQKALDMLLDDKIDQEAYDTVVKTINPKIDLLVKQLSLLQYEENNSNVGVEDFKTYISHQFNPKEPLTALTDKLLARLIHKIIVKADGQLEVHYRISKPSAFFVSTNIKLEIPKTHPNKAYVKKHN